MGCGSSTPNVAATSGVAAVYQVSGEEASTSVPPGTPKAPAAAAFAGDFSRQRSVSKRLTLPSLAVAGGAVGTTTLNLAALQATSEEGLRGPSSGRRSARRGSGATQEADHEKLLVSIPFFEALEPKAIRKLRDVFSRRRYAQGEWISRNPEHLQPGEATPPAVHTSEADFFVIISGEIKLSVRVLTSKTTSGANGKASLAQPAARPDPSQLPATESEDITLAVLRDGQWFGGDTLVQETFQRADILALSDCVLLCISRDAFRAFAQQMPSLTTTIADTLTNTRVSLHSLPFFSSIDELKLQQLSHLLEFRRFQAGDRIIAEGDIGDGFFVIVTGVAHVTVVTREHATFLLSVLSDGQFFGETSLIYSSPRVATVTATTPMLTLFLSSSRFKAFARLAPEIFSDAFDHVAKHRTVQILKTFPLFDAICSTKPTSATTATTPTAFAMPGESPVAHARGLGSLINVAPLISPGAPPRKLTADPLTPLASSVPGGPVGAAALEVQSYDEAKLSILASLFTYESFHQSNGGQVIFHEGSRADKLFIIVRGRAEVSAEVESGRVVLNQLTQGDVFGEISLLFPTVRSATVTALEPCLCLCLAADKFGRFLEIAPELRERLSFAVGPRVASIIENIPFFRDEIRENKPWSKLGLLGELCAFRKAEENEIIFSQGDQADAFYVLVAGAVLVTKHEAGPSSFAAEAVASSGGSALTSDHPQITVADRRSTLEFPSPPTSPSAGPRKDHGRHLPSLHTPGVILRRGNYFGSECFDGGDGAVRCVTVTALTLSVFLTLTQAQFRKYLTVAPELRELLLKRQQTSRAAPSDQDPKAALEKNRSMEASPIFSTVERHLKLSTPTTTRAAMQSHQPPNTNRAQTIGVINSSGSSSTHTAAAAAEAARHHHTSYSGGSWAPGPALAANPFQRSSLGASSPTSLADVGARPSAAGRLPSLTPLGVSSKPTPALSPLASATLGRAPLGSLALNTKGPRPSVLAKELQAYEEQNTVARSLPPI